MEIRDRKTVQGVTSARKASAGGAASAAPAATVALDVLAIGGVPAVELTPNVRRALDTLMAEVEQLRTELEDARSRIGFLEKLVDEDPLIPVVNRRAFVRELTRMMAFAQRYGVPASILYFDINGMKRINDTYGHAAGDATLVTIAKVLLENVRTTDVVGRLGGDELGVLLVQADQALADRKAAELVALIEERPTPWQGTAIHVKVACGAHAFVSGDTAGDIIEAADRAMYHKKTTMKEAR